jgi:nitroreductase
MDLRECVESRRSVRAFKSQPVPKEVLAKILDEARRSPSCANTQPWEFTVFGGQKMEEIRRACKERFLSKAEPNPDIPYPFMEWPEPYRSRRMSLSRGLHELLKIDSNDPEQMQEHGAQGFSFFGAPHGIVICIDNCLPTWSILDVGIMLQTILLLAHDNGLGCCAQLQMVAHPDILRKWLDIPMSKKIVIGISLGYPDEQDVINKHVSERLPLDQMVTWHGM